MENSSRYGFIAGTFIFPQCKEREKLKNIIKNVDKQFYL